MLIEAQAQKLLLDQKKSKIDEENKEDSISMEIDDNSSKDGNKLDSDVEMKESDEKPPEEPAKKDELEEQPIDIDPKTYCKLGHFHLLLEDYAKGKNIFISY